MFALPVMSGELENAINTSDKVFLYLYTDNCRYCIMFNSIYSKIYEKYNKNCKFVKVNANSEYGNLLMRNANASYVPYVALINTEAQTLQKVQPECMLKSSCMKNTVERFLK